MFRRAENVNEVKTRKNGDARPLKNLLVTGGCGFIGSNFINLFLRSHPGVKVYNIDKMDYCANRKSVLLQDPMNVFDNIVAPSEDEKATADYSANYQFIRGDIANTDLIMHVLHEKDIDTILHFAAQSHVDNSFGNSMTFTVNNVVGTHNLLECARVYGKIEKFIHVSTDEVYGEVSSSQKEEGTLNPTNPYAATKAAVEYIVKAYHISFGLPCLITRGNNVYGKHQYPEKVIPRFIMLLNANQKMTIQGSGNNTRTFIHAEDVARAFATIVDNGVIGEVYNIGSRDEHSVNAIAQTILSAMKPGEKLDDWVTYVRDRDFNDERYDIDTSKLMAFGWKQQVEFTEGIKSTVAWYQKALNNGFWSDIRMDIPQTLVEYPVQVKH